MKKSALTLFLILIGNIGLYAQIQTGWNTNQHEVKFVSESGEISLLEVDAGFKYAQFQIEDKKLHFFFNRDKQAVKHIRIIDEQTKLPYGRGRGSWFWGNARLEFENGEKLQLIKDQTRNGYSIIGPYGAVFLVENQKISATKTFNEKEEVAQAFFVFDRLRTTQKPLNEVLIHSTGFYTPLQ